MTKEHAQQCSLTNWNKPINEQINCLKGGLNFSIKKLQFCKFFSFSEKIWVVQLWSMDQEEQQLPAY